MTIVEPPGEMSRTDDPAATRPVRRRRALLFALAAIMVALGTLNAEPSGPRPNAGGSRTHAADPNASAATPSFQPPSGYAVDCLAVGAAVTVSSRDDAASRLFRQVTRELGPLTIRRSFESKLPSAFDASSAGGDAATGLHSFASWKPPNGDHRGAAAGRYDRQIAAWAASVPRTGVFATAFHEPENDMTASEFVAFQRHVYTVVKKTNPTIHWGPVYMAYWWDPGQPAHYVGNPAAWWPGSGYADFAALDWYGLVPVPMTTSSSFTNWFRSLAPTGLPLLVTEYGQYFHRAGQPSDPVMEQARADAIRKDAAWLLGHPQFKAWLYWQGGDSGGTWQLTDPASQAAWRAVADRGCRP